MGHVAHVRQKTAQRVWWEHKKERGHFEDLGVDVRVNINVYCKENDGILCIEFIWLRIRTTGRALQRV